MANYNNSRTSPKSKSPTNNSGKNNSGKNNSGVDNTYKNQIQPNPLKPTPSSDAFQSYNLSPILPGESSGLSREGFNKKQFDDTIDTRFTQLGIPIKPDPSTFDPSLATVGDFFTIYQSLFYQIPKEGAVNSHTFLIKDSTNYVQYIAQQAEIEELLEEINELRTQNIDLIADIAELGDKIGQGALNING